MRYWAYCAAKLVAAGASLYGLLWFLSWVWPPAPKLFTYIPPRFGYDLGFTLAVLVWFLLCSGTFYLIIWDQRHRCRVCLRRLRMLRGDRVRGAGCFNLAGRASSTFVLTATEPLREDEFQISGLANPEWTRHSDDLWEELCASSKDSGEQP